MPSKPKDFESIPKGYRDLRAKEGFGKRPGLENSQIPQEQTTSKRTRSITGIQDLADRPHADK